MSIVVSCDCGKRFKAKDEMAGKKVRCPECQTVLRIPNGNGDASTAVGAKSAVKKSASSATAEKVDAQAALARYEAAQKKKALEAEADAAYKLEQQKIIESYDQLAGKATPTELAKKKNKEELTETGVKKPTVVTKAADATGSFFSNLFVKYVIIAALLGAATIGSIQLVKYVTGYVNEDMTKVNATPRDERIKALFNDARAAVTKKDYAKAQKCLDEVLKLDVHKETNNTFVAIRKSIDQGRSGGKP